jgi:predicted alpha-1,6-mannanase (GH76 family)
LSITGALYFSSLSALLAEATGDPMYLQAAEQSTEFMRAHLVDAENAVQDGISGASSDACNSTAIHMEPYNSGLMIEGLAVLGSVTPNASTQAL